MYDSNNVQSNDVSYEFDVQDEGLLNLTIKASSEWINHKDRLFPIYIDPQIIAPNIYLPNLKIYQIDSSGQYQVSSGSLSVDYGKKIGVNIPMETFKDFIVSKFEVEFAQIYISEPVTVYFQNCTVKLPNSGFQQLCSSPNFGLNDFSGAVNITWLYSQWVSNKQDYGTVIFSHNGQFWFRGSVYLPVIIITYTLNTKKPNDYLEYGTNHLIELATGAEVDLIEYENSLEQGVLTTYVDTSVPKIHQTFMIDGKNYYRYSNKLSSGDLFWLEWEREIKFNIVGDTLFITD